MLKVIKQKLPLIEDKIFRLIGEPDVISSQLNRRVAREQFKDALGNVLFIVFSGMAMFATLFGLSLLFASISNVALLAKSITDAMFQGATFLPKIAIAAIGGYLGTKMVYVKFTEWEMRKALKKEKEILKANAPCFTHNPNLINQPVVPEISFTSGASIVMISSNLEPTTLPTDNDLQDLQTGEGVPVVNYEEDVQNFTPQGTASPRNSISVL